MQNHPLSASIERYAALRQATWHSRTVKRRRGIIYLFLRFVHQRDPRLRRWSELTRRRHIEPWLISIRDLKPATRIENIHTIELFFDDMREWQWADLPPRNLFFLSDRPPAARALPKPLSPELDEAVMQRLSNDPSLPALGLRLMRATGIRCGELIDMHIDAVRREPDGTFSLWIPLGKTYRDRLIPVTPQTADLVEQIRQQRGRAILPKSIPDHLTEFLMLNERGHHAYEIMFWRKLKRIGRLLGTTESLHPHRLRHTFATEMIRAGMRIEALMKILGHRSPQMTMRYVQVSNDDIRNAFENALHHSRATLVLKRALPSIDPPEPAPRVLAQFEMLIFSIDRIRRDLPAQHPSRTALRRAVQRLRRARTDILPLIPDP